MGLPLLLNLFPSIFHALSFVIRTLTYIYLSHLKKNTFTCTLTYWWKIENVRHVNLFMCMLKKEI